jgi:hypothetical protein
MNIKCVHNCCPQQNCKQDGSVVHNDASQIVSSTLHYRSGYASIMLKNAFTMMLIEFQIKYHSRILHHFIHSKVHH